MKTMKKVNNKLKLFMEKLTNIYIYIYGLRKNKEGRLFTNKKQSLFKNGRRLLLTNNFLFGKVVKA